MPKKEAFKTHFLKEHSIRLYCQHLDEYLDDRALILDMNLEWNDLKEVIQKAASETLGKRSIRHTKKAYLYGMKKLLTL